VIGLLLVLVTTGAAVLGGVIVLRALDVAEQRASLVRLDLRFPSGTESSQIEAFLGAVSGMLPPWWRRWHHLPFIGIEVEATEAGIAHRLLVPRASLRTIAAALAAHLPDVSYRVVDVGVRPDVRRGIEYRLTDGGRSLSVEPAVQSGQLLAAMQPLARGERVVLQALLAPARPVSPARLATAGERDGSIRLDDGVLVSSEAVTALRKKQASPLLLTSLRLGSLAGSVKRERHLLRQIEAGLHGTRAPGTHLVRRLISEGSAASRIRDLRVPLHRWPAILNTSEAAGLVGLPVGEQRLPGLQLLGSRPLAVPSEVPRTGSLLGVGTHPRTERPVAVDGEGRRHHVLLLGPTGSGKSVLATHTVTSFVSDRRTSAAVLDPKDGDLVDAICARVPERRLDDVIVLDPTEARPVGFNPLASTPATRELVVDRVLALMVDIWGSNIGPRSADILRHGLLTVAQSPKLTMVELPRLISDAQFRRRVVAALPEEADELRDWWAWAESLSAGEWSAMTAAPLNKLRALVSRQSVAHVIGQDKPAIDFGRVLNGQQILLVRLPVGLLGDETTALLGALVVNQIWHAIAARAALPASQRPPATVVIDEVGTVLRFPGASIGSMLTQARGYGVGITLAAQHLDQLPVDLRKTTLANARTKVIFAPSHDDAVVLARSIGHGLKPEDLTGLEAYDAIAAVHAAGRTQDPASIHATAPSEPLRRAEVVRRRSAQRWGVDRADVQAAIRARTEQVTSAPSAPVGRKRRSS
jgi:hypothetical protein